MKDSESTSFVSIYGIQEEHDVAETISVKAIIRPCDENVISLFKAMCI